MSKSTSEYVSTEKRTRVWKGGHHVIRVSLKENLWGQLTHVLISVTIDTGRSETGVTNYHVPANYLYYQFFLHPDLIDQETWRVLDDALENRNLFPVCDKTMETYSGPGEDALCLILTEACAAIKSTEKKG